MKGVVGKTPMLKFDDKSQVWLIDRTHAYGLALLAAIDALIAACRNGLKTMVIFDATLKDEVLPMRKVDDVRTRIILGAPVEATIVHRKYLATLGAAISSLHNEIPVKVGINPYNEWDTLFKQMNEVSDYGFDSDFKSWDSTVPSVCLHAIADLYVRICAAHGYQEGSLDTISGLYNHIVNPVLSFRGELYLCRKGLPSGQPFTALDNSLVNWGLVLVAWKRSCEKISRPAFSSFESDVVLAVYGDDNMAAVAENGRTHFSPSDIEALATEIGMEVTSVSKQSGIADYVPVISLSFLSRFFNTNAQYFKGKVVGRLKPASLYKLLGFVRQNKRLKFRRGHPDCCTDRQKLNELLQAAQIEAALLGPYGYKCFQQTVQRGAEQLGLQFVTENYQSVVAAIFRD